MRRIVLFLIVMVFGLRLNAQTNTETYDSTLAKRFGADERGMKSYILVILKSGPNKLEQGPVRENLFKGHFENINRMAESGKLVIAGPLEDNNNSYRGIFILNVKTKDEAKDLLKSDPTIREKIFDADLYEWYGSAAISEYLKVQKRIEKKHF